MEENKEKWKGKDTALVNSPVFNFVQTASLKTEWRKENIREGGRCVERKR